MGLLELVKKTPDGPPEMTVIDAVRAMAEAHSGAFVVKEGGRLAGVFTERDLMRRVVLLGKDPTETRLREVMTTPVHSVTDDTPIAKAVSLMREHHIRHLAIVDANGACQGLLALRYVLYEMMDELEDRLGNLYGYVMTDAPGG